MFVLDDKPENIYSIYSNSLSFAVSLKTLQGAVDYDPECVFKFYREK